MNFGQTAGEINHYFNMIANEPDEKERLVYNDSLTNTIISYLDSHEDITGTDIPGIKYLGQITPSDSIIKIFTWNIPVSGGNNVFNCIIYNSLSDKNILLKGEKGLADLETDAVIHSNDWYGSLYYDIQAVGNEEEMTYILLGFDPDNIYMNAKVIEILHFDEEGKPVFGKKIFSTKNRILTRMIFKYSPLATMMLKVDPERSMIIFDHLSPSSPQFEGQYTYYGPDFSYDALEIKDGKLILVEDIDLRNKNKQ
ncbi:MAG: hypothetical protein U9N72_11410 [Bacteroidota bacterium]|nr:hypothetical protein [Bacteroidota bacterium]